MKTENVIMLVLCILSLIIFMINANGDGILSLIEAISLVMFNASWITLILENAVSNIKVILENAF